jgi:pimeloyl-ACP methyl ester carboxylesterase
MVAHDFPTDSAKRRPARLAALAAALLLAPPAWGEGVDGALPRRAFFGVALGTAVGEGVPVTSVLPESTAADVGIGAGDVIRMVDGVAMTTPAEVTAAFGRHRGGDVVDISLLRNGEHLSIDATLKTLPFETMAGAAMEYGSVATADGVRLRTILSMPLGAADPAPAVMLIQGGGCGSIDTPIGPPVAQPGLMHAIGTEGFVTFRVEKSGIGDSAGPPCAEIGYFEELDGYRAGLAALRAHPAVDPERVFLVGISLGGVFAPILANETPVAGLIAYGTIDFAPSPYPGRSERFFSEIADVDVLEEWTRIDAPALILHGELDETTEADWHASIAAAVNGAHPGLAEHRELAGLDHCWTRHPSMEASIGRCGQGEAATDLSDAILAFLWDNA